MEASFPFALLASWFPSGSQPDYGRAAQMLAIAFVGYAVTVLLPTLRIPGPNLLPGALLLAAVHLATTAPPAAFARDPVMAWLGGAIIPGLFGAGLWWRGAQLAESAPSARWVLNTFATIGALLLFALGFYGSQMGIEPSWSVALTIVYLVSGLVAISLSRQEEAGTTATAGSRAIAAFVALAFVILGGLPFLLLTPEVATIAQTIANLLGQAVLLFAMFLVWLFSWLPAPELPEQERRPAGPSLPEASASSFTLPGWAEALLGVFASLFVGLFVIAVVVAVGLLLFALFERATYWGRRDARAPTAIEHEGSPWQDAARWLASLGRRLGGTSRDLAARLHLPFDERDARSAQAAYRSLLRWARRQGIERQPAETPRELADRLHHHLPAGQVHYTRLTTAYVGARYGQVAPSPVDLAQLAASLSDLHHLPPAAHPTEQT